MRGWSTCGVAAVLGLVSAGCDRGYGVEAAFADWEAACVAEREAWVPWASSSLALTYKKATDDDPFGTRSLLNVHLNPYGMMGEPPIGDAEEVDSAIEFLNPEFIEGIELLEKLLELGDRSHAGSDLKVMEKAHGVLKRHLQELARQQVSMPASEMSSIRSWVPGHELQQEVSGSDLDPRVGDEIEAELAQIKERYRRALDAVATAQEVLEAHLVANVGRPKEGTQHVDRGGVNAAYNALRDASDGLLEASIRRRAAEAFVEAKEAQLDAIDARLEGRLDAPEAIPARLVEFDWPEDDPFTAVAWCLPSIDLRAGGTPESGRTVEERRVLELQRARQEWDSATGELRPALERIRAAWRMEPLPDPEEAWLLTRREWARHELQSVRKAAEEAAARQPEWAEQVQSAREEFDRIRRTRMLSRIALLTGMDLSGG